MPPLPVSDPAAAPRGASDRIPSPQVIGRYALFDEIASGGMATVHLGRLAGSAGFSRTIAIKRLHPQFAKDPEFVSMFLDEARLASRIQHPNVVATLDVVADVGEVFLVMEYVGGEALSKLMRNAFDANKPIPADVAVSIVCDMLHGLHAAHEAKSESGEPLSIVHRDVSPQNVLVGLDGIARVLDFGIAKAAMRAQSTREGQVKGKLSYMSPEQLNAKEIDRRADVFAVGVVAWEALCGRRLFAGDDAGEIFGKLLSGPISAPNDELEKAGKRMAPAAVSDAVIKALARDPDERFATARDFAIALEAAIVVAPPHRVGEWVQEFGGPELLGRQRMVTQIERYSFSFPDEFTPNPVSTGVAPVSKHSDDVTQRDVRPSRAEPASDEQSPAQRSRRRWRRLAIVLGLIALLATARALWDLGEPQPEPVPMVVIHRQDSAARAVPSDEPATVPTTATAVPPSSAAPSAAASSSATSKWAAPVLHGVAPKRAPPPRKDPCNPPWRVDSRGIRHPIPGCY